MMHVEHTITVSGLAMIMAVLNQTITTLTVLVFEGATRLQPEKEEPLVLVAVEGRRKRGCPKLYRRRCWLYAIFTFVSACSQYQILKWLGLN
jgi:hypothetical protein